MNTNILKATFSVWMVRLCWLWLFFDLVFAYSKWFSIYVIKGHVFYLSVILLYFIMVALTFLRKAWAWWALIIGGFAIPAATYACMDYLLELKTPSPLEFFDFVIIWYWRLKWGLLTGVFLILDKNARRYFDHAKAKRARGQS